MSDNATVVAYDTAGNAWPAGTEYALCYLNGDYANVGYVREHFPAAKILTISVVSSESADILDVENGDATSEEAAGVLDAGLFRSAYGSLSTGDEIASMVTRPWNYFPADPTSVPHFPEAPRLATVVGCQYAWAALNQTQGRNIDISVVLESFFGITPPAPPIPQETDMLAPSFTGNGYYIAHPDGSVWCFGDAEYQGGCNPGAPTKPGGPPVPAGLLTGGEVVTSITAHPKAQGYWLRSSAGHVFAFGAAAWHGNA